MRISLKQISVQQSPQPSYRTHQDPSPYLIARLMALVVGRSDDNQAIHIDAFDRAAHGILHCASCSGKLIAKSHAIHGAPAMAWDLGTDGDKLSPHPSF